MSFLVLQSLTKRFGVMPKGRVLVGPGSAGSRFYVQLIEPEPGPP